MGAPRRRRTRLPTRVLSRPLGLSRRAFLSRLGAAAATLLAVPLLPGCGDSVAPDGSGGWQQLQ